MNTLPGCSRRRNVDVNRISDGLKAEREVLAVAEVPPANGEKKQGTIMASAAAQPAG